MKKILFLSVGRRVELVQEFQKDALALGKDIQIYGEDIDSTAVALAFCDRRFQLCGIKDKKYFGQLLEKKCTATDRPYCPND